MSTTMILRGAGLVILALAAGIPAIGSSYYLAPDSPTSLDGSWFAPWEIVRSDSAAYGLELSLPVGTHVNALHRLDDGDWLFSVDSTTILGVGEYEPRDVIRYDGSDYSMYFHGFGVGIPDASSIDAITLRGGEGDPLILSFDVPTTLGAVTYEPADLVQYAGGFFSPYFNASSASPPIPLSSNVTGADLREGSTILTFDVPTTLGSDTFLPGQLVAWNGAEFRLYFRDPTWPRGSSLAALAFLADPGPVATTVRMRKSVKPTNVFLEWQQGCSVGAEDYAVYEGTLGVWYDHQSVDCSDDDANFVEEITTSPGDRYYLVVAHNPNDEGPYGWDSDENIRPAGSNPCVETSVASWCP